MAETIRYTLTVYMTCGGQKTDNIMEKDESLDAVIIRGNDQPAYTSDKYKVTSAKINLSTATFYVSSGGPYIKIGKYGTVKVRSDTTDKTAMALLNNDGNTNMNKLLSVDSSTSVCANIYAGLGSSGRVISFPFDYEHGITSVTYTIIATVELKAVKSTATVTSKVSEGAAVSVKIVNESFTNLSHMVLFYLDDDHKHTESDIAKSCSYTIPNSWYNGLGSSFKVRVTTYLDGSSLGYNEYTVKLVPGSSHTPTVTNLAITQLSTSPTYSWGNHDVYVKGISSLRASCTASSDVGCTINSYNLAQGGVSTTKSTLPISFCPASSGNSVPVKMTAYDVNNRSGSSVLNIKVYDYSNPKITASVAFRCDSLGAEKDTGTYLSVNCCASFTAIESYNSLTIRVYYQIYGASSWTSGGTLSSGTTTIIGNGTIATANRYKIKFEVEDTVGTVVSATKVVEPEGYVMFMRMDGTGVAFGEESTRTNAVEIVNTWSLYNGNNKYVLGNASGVAQIASGGTGATTAAAARANLGAKAIVASSVTDSTGYTITAGGTESVSIDMTKTGYTFLGILSVRITDAPRKVAVLNWRAVSASATVNLYNITSSSVSTGDITIKGLYIEN